MAWTNPKTWAFGELLTSSDFNTEFKDNLRFLKGLDGPITLDAALTVTGSITAGSTNDISGKQFVSNEPDTGFGGTPGISLISTGLITNANAEYLNGKTLAKIDNTHLTSTGTKIGTGTITTSAMALNKTGKWLLLMSSQIQNGTNITNETFRTNVTADANGTVTFQDTGSTAGSKTANDFMTSTGICIYTVNTANSSPSFVFTGTGIPDGSEEINLSVIAIYLES